MLDSLKHVDATGVYFVGREVQECIGYTWQQFNELVQEHIKNCEQFQDESGVIETRAMRKIGMGSLRPVVDYKLSPFAFLSVLMLMRSNKHEIKILRREAAKELSSRFMLPLAA
ncbi:hypothetical protein EI42_04242 [Thermosporothrix hazakensis]|jgi:hypothetical protein|uniref:Uncharacterized protein n=2 Tax=Thermosporothrix TaxID=768650 RepID=A0A326U267_THEHA|nr:hypothetical protein [Thermosporothrix hazakensis]PZW25398.1 hypothetical protein EI42_04242 [Thermosporothrix hazakensis]BBH90732.1 hypothetical protein KTC_54830 [Thermosporothrix sp. COM3]GCE48782.1 hypothetical protein KTH_36510 [Thermosporothrix hazakensis]